MYLINLSVVQKKQKGKKSTLALSFITLVNRYQGLVVPFNNQGFDHWLFLPLCFE